MAIKEKGKAYFFEYHCTESEKSCDAELWHHTHQKVTILRRLKNKVEVDESIGRMYRVKFPDGFEYDVLEEELLDSPRQYTRAAYYSPKKTNLPLPNPHKPTIVKTGPVTWNISKIDLPIYDEVIHAIGTPQAKHERYIPSFKWTTLDYFYKMQVKQLHMRRKYDKEYTGKNYGIYAFHHGIIEDHVKNLMRMMTGGKEIFPAFYLEFDKNGKLLDYQEGRHRILALKQLGIKYVPVWSFRRKY